VQHRQECARRRRRRGIPEPDDGDRPPNIPAPKPNEHEGAGAQLTFDRESAAPGHAITTGHGQLHRLPGWELGALNVSVKPDVPMSVYVSDVREIERLVGGDRTKSLVLYCNGPYCGKSRRLFEELLGAGFTSVRRYQLGIPVWRALGGLTQIRLEGVTYVHASDRTAVFLDARSAEEFSAGTISGARTLPAAGLRPGKDVGEVKRAKDDGRLPMEDHNTRIVVFGRDGAQASLVAEALVNEAFHNVAFFDGPFPTIKAATR
jgi:rhodanese-related sulfurtransferase